MIYSWFLFLTDPLYLPTKTCLQHYSNLPFHFTLTICPRTLFTLPYILETQNNKWKKKRKRSETVASPLLFISLSLSLFSLLYKPTLALPCLYIALSFKRFLYYINSLSLSLSLSLSVTYSVMERNQMLRQVAIMRQSFFDQVWSFS
jgi:hypothetical protein